MAISNQKKWHSLIIASAISMTSSVAYAADTTVGQTTELRPIIPSQSTQPLKLETAVSIAVQQYPKIAEYQARVRSAQAGVKLQKINEYVPSSMASWQEVAASHNKLTQILFGNAAIPANPGPGEPLDTWHGDWFSAAGFIVDWTGIDFGLHKARISYSKSLLGQSTANMALTQLDVAENTANAFLALIVARQQVRAGEANVHNMTVFSQAAHSLVTAGLKPGADASLADAQLAEAQNQLIQLRQQQEIAEAELLGSMGQPPLATVAIDESPVIQTSEPPIINVGLPDYAAHPLALYSRSIIETALAQRQVIKHSYDPVIHWLGGINLRGSGLDIHGKYQKKDAYGLMPVHPNWNVGVMLTWNFMDIFSVHEQKVVNTYNVQAEQGHYSDIIQQLKIQDARSRAMVKGAVALARNMPVELAAARDAEIRSRTRYQNGLATVAEVAQAEQLLMQAQVKMAVAEAGVWRALLAVSHARGDIKPFLAEVTAARTRM